MGCSPKSLPRMQHIPTRLGGEVIPRFLPGCHTFLAYVVLPTLWRMCNILRICFVTKAPWKILLLQNQWMAAKHSFENAFKY